jgi:hypothetical protein
LEAIAIYEDYLANARPHAERSDSVQADVRRALKLWAYIESLADNGVDIRCAGNLWMIGDHWNETTEATGNGLAAAVDALPDRTANDGLHRPSEAQHNQKGPTS